MFRIELSKQVIWFDPVWFTTNLSFGESIKLDSFISESKKFKSGPTHHGLVG